MNNPDENLNLRSEKIRKLLSEIPKFPLWIGTSVIVLILLAIISALIFLPYPYSENETILEHILRSI